MASLDGRENLAGGPLDDGFASVESSVTMVRAIFPWGDVGAQIEYGERALVLEPTSSPWYPVGVYAVGLGSYFAGNIGNARKSLAVAHDMALPAQQWLVAGSSLAYGSIAASEASDWQAQHQLAELAAAFAAEFQIEDVAGEVHVALGLSYAVQGDIQAARSLLERGVLVLRAWAQPTELAEALLRLGTVCRAQGDIGRMRSAFDEARAVVESCVDPGKLPQRLTVLDPAETSGPQDRAALTDREIVILRHLASDQSERQIAESLYVSPNTVHTQVRSVYNKLGVTSRSDAVSRARALGLL